MAGPSGAIRAGRAFVEMFADPSALIRGLEQAKKRVEQFGKFTKKVGLSAAAAGGVVFTPLAAMFTDAVKEGADLAGLSKKYQMPVAALSELKNAFAEAGVGGDEFSAILDKLNARIVAATDANEQLIPGLQGLSGRELINKNSLQQLEAVFDLFERLGKNGTVADFNNQIAALGLEKLAPYLRKGAAGFAELKAQAGKNNTGWGAEDAAAAETVFKEYNQTIRSVKGTILEVGRALLPAGQDFATVGAQVRENLAAVRDWIREHKQIILIVTAAAGALMAGGLAVAGFGAAVAVAAPIIGGLIIAVKALVLVVGACLSPIGLVVAGVAAVGVGIAYLVTRTEAGAAAFQELKDMVGEAAEFIRGSWKGITDAIGAGNFSLAFEIGLKSAEVAWRDFVVKLTTIWVGFKSVFVDTWEDATTWLAKAMVTVAAGIESVVNGVLRTILDNFNTIAAALKQDHLKIDYSSLATNDKIGREAGDKIKAIEDQAAAEKKRRAEFRAGQIGDAKTALEIAKEQLEILKEQAAEEAKRDQGAPEKAPPTAAPQQKSPPSFTALSEFAKGTFGSSSIQQSLGFGDNVGQRQLDAQIGIQENTAISAKVLQDIAAKPGAKFT